MSKEFSTNDLLNGMLQVSKALGVEDTAVAEKLLAPVIKGLIDERDQYIALSGDRPEEYDDHWHISVSSGSEATAQREPIDWGPKPRIPLCWGRCTRFCLPVPFTDRYLCWTICYGTCKKD